MGWDGNEVGVGDVVTFVDANGVSWPALIQAVWEREGLRPSLNLVRVSPDPLRTDTYGRQITHETSVPHREQQAANGSYWTL